MKRKEYKESKRLPYSDKEKLKQEEDVEEWVERESKNLLQWKKRMRS